MWFFQHKSMFNDVFLWIILSISTFVHLVILAGLFFFYRSADECFTVLIDRTMLTDLHISLLPSFVNKTNSIKSFPVVFHKNAPAIHSVNSSIKKQVSTEKNKIKETKGPILTAEKNVPKKAKNIPAVAKRMGSKIANKAGSSVKKNTNISKKDVQKNEKKQESKKVNAIKKQEQKIVEKNVIEKKESITTNKQINEQTIIDNQSMYEQSLELSAQEFEILKRIDYLQKELVRVWHPPMVQKSNPSCTIELFIDWKGIIKTVEIVKSSGVMLFDTAARKAAYDISIPEWAKGKSITIMLKA